MRSTPPPPRLGFIGFGEVGKILAVDLLKTGAFASACAWDLKFAGTDSAKLRRECRQLGVAPSANLGELVASSDFIISAVTAANTLAVAKQTAKHSQPRQVFLDLNSASPATKRLAHAVINSTGAYYVEAGVMTSVPPYRMRVPMLLGGKQALRLSLFLNALGMDTQVAAQQIGTASAIKMCRSIMIKGLEGLVIESFTTARRYGVETQVLNSLTETFPQINWQQQGSYFFSRVAQHGRRRAEEMRESANTVAQGGFEPIMASAIANKHQAISQHSQAGYFRKIDGQAQWQDYADALIRRSR